MEVGDRLISKINFNDFVEKGREYYITSFSNSNSHMDIKRIDNKGGTATFLKEFVYDNFDNATNEEKTYMNFIEAVNYLQEHKDNRVETTCNWGWIYRYNPSSHTKLECSSPEDDELDDNDDK